MKRRNVIAVGAVALVVGVGGGAMANSVVGSGSDTHRVAKPAKVAKASGLVDCPDGLETYGSCDDLPTAMDNATPVPAPDTAPVETAAPPKPKPSLVYCDANIRVKAATTTCSFGNDAFYEIWHRWTYRDGDYSDLHVWSNAAGEWLATDCTGYDSVTCRTDDGGVVKFPLSAVEAYTLKQANAYYDSDATLSVGPHAGADDLPATTDVAPGDTAPDASNDYSVPDYTTPDTTTPDYTTPDPYGDDDYTNHDGSYDGSPTTQNFGSGNGAIGQCADGTYSDSIGVQGACSYHGGVG